MAAPVATDGKGNWITLNAAGDWVPTSPPAEKETGTAPEAVGDTVVSPDDMARVNAPPANPPITSLSDLRDRIQQGDISTLKSLAPGPDAGPIESGARYAAMTGVHGLASLAQWPINALMGLGQGTGGLTIDPATNRLNQTPEGLAALQLFAPGAGVVGGRDVQFSGANAFKREAPSTLEQAGITKPPPVTLEELRAAINRVPEPPQNQMMPGEATPPSGPGSGYRQNVDPTKPFTYNPPSEGWPAGTESWAEKQPAPEGAAPRPESQPTPPQPAGAETVPTTSDAARAVAKAYYERFDKAAQDGGSLNPQATDRFIASVEAAAPPPGIGQAVAGKNAITDLVERLQDYKGQPMSLQDAHVVYQELGHLISAEYSRNGVSSIGRQLQEIQHKFGDQLSNPEAGDVVSGQAGLDALAPARKAYSQARKLDTIERIQERADMTDNPTTSFRTQIRTLLTNDKLSRGFSEEEKAALRDAANRGIVSSVLHLMGSRLIPIISGSTGGGVFGAAVGYGLNEAARAGQNALATRRLQNAYTILGKSVPNPPAPP